MFFAKLKYQLPIVLQTAAMILLLLAACYPIPGAPSPTVPSPPTNTPAPTAVPTQPPLEPIPPTEQPTPQVDTPTPEPEATATQILPSGPVATLGFLKEGNLWLAELPTGELHQVTQSGDLLSFAWSPDGKQIATFNGHQLCRFPLEDSTAQDCLDLELDEFQAVVERQIVWSPDLSTIVLWNPINPWDESAIGWLVIRLETSTVAHRIEDPVDWGLGIAPNNEPGGITGQPVFLADNTLVGTLTHRWLCGSGGCHYQLYQFDSQAHSFSPYPNKPDEGWSEGRNLSISQDQRLLVNFGTFFASCESYVTFIDIFDLTNQSRRSLNLDMEALSHFALAPDATQAVIARVAGCGVDNPQSWDRACGLSQGFDIYPMQLWDLANDQRTDLLPGTTPQWSPDGEWITFRSCLAQNASGVWETTASVPASIFATDRSMSALRLIADGLAPAWKP